MSSSPRPPRRSRRWPRRVLALILTLVGLAGAGMIAFDVAERVIAPQLPPIVDVEDYRRHALQTTRVFAADGTLVDEVWRERRRVVPRSQMPRVLLSAAVAAEDGDFYRHPGLDLWGILRAALVNLRDGRLSQGASTITQQVARSFYLSQAKTLERKLREVFLARKLERHLTKDEILELYLNQIYFGHGRWGVAEATRHYLGRSVGELDAADAALLMSLVPAPERLNPLDDPAGARRRRDRVLDRMEQGGHIGAHAARLARASQLRLAAPSDGSGPPAPWFADVVRRRLERALGRATVLRGGLDVHTSLDPHAQRAVDRAVTDHLGSADVTPEVAVVLMDVATRQVRALVGGSDPERSAFNRAVQAHRQAGSTFKPFVYGAALEAGRAPEDTYDDVVTCYPGGARRWCPQNATGRHDGAAVRLDDALARSLNVVAVRLMRDVGVADVTSFARRAGLRSPIPANLTAALGSGEVTPLELANAYATFADRGRAGEPVFITRVERRDGTLVYSEAPERRRAMVPDVAAGVRAALALAVREGTGRAADVDGVHVAGKTGTTDRRVDAWFAGLARREGGSHAGLAGAVWVGFDARESLAHGSGGRTAAPIFRDVIQRVLGPDRAAMAPEPLR